MTKVKWETRIIKRMNNSVKYYVETPNATIRSCAKFIGVSKSTTFLDLKYRFKEFLNEPTIVKFNIILDSDSPYLSDNFYKLVSDKMMTNFNNKYYTGGEATKRLWKLRKENTYGKIAKN